MLQVAREIVKVILAEGLHEIIVLSRKVDAPSDLLPDLKWTKVNYEDKEQLVKALKGMHTVLSFIVTHLEVGCVAQINLIDTCVKVGVKRFSPSEWVMTDLNGSQFYDNKLQIRRYLENLNKPKKSDLETDKFTTSWAPELNHPTIAVDTRKAVAKRYLRCAMLGLAKGAWDIPDVWNQLLPEVEFTKLEDFLQATWDKAE
ncbi:hypothetical protein Forpe1208_v016780 [Fusarium oxysporum f. sp. rapae]|uniref:NmrA-like domain-containing protein n=1 Tax=Fusarium oxysporum f. sp. rapae TaxID=485398 RepID=A0A8J5TMP9_FUSOX|nr:hypothetical protein Forpe1208_v016780 [Fusarium oxysporum f. sp. rapae]